MREELHSPVGGANREVLSDFVQQACIPSLGAGAAFTQMKRSSAIIVIGKCKYVGDP